MNIKQRIKEILTNHQDFDLENNPNRFFRSMKEANEGMSTMDDLVCVVSSVSGRIVNNHENKFDTKTVEILFLRKTDLKDFDAVCDAQEECYQLGMDFFAKLEKETVDNGDEYFSPESVQYTEVDLMFDCFAGIKFTFLPEFPQSMQYDESKWL